MPKKTKILPTIRPKRILSTFGITLVIATGYLGCTAYLDHSDKQKFEIVKESMNKLANKLQDASGVEWVVSASCSQGSVKFQEPKKACGVGVRHDFKVTNEEQANGIINKYEKAFLEASNLFVFEKKYEPAPPNFPSGLTKGINTSKFKEKHTNMTCSGTIQIEDKNSKSMKVSFGCNDEARKLHYPRNDI